MVALVLRAPQRASGLFALRLHGQRIAQGEFGDWSKSVQFDGMVGVTEQDVFFLADDQDDCLGGIQVFLCGALHVREGDGLDSIAVLLPEIGFFGIPAGEFVLGEGVRDLGFGGEHSREGVDE